MDINRGNLEMLYQNLSTSWQQGMDEKPIVGEPAADFVFTEFPSATASNIFAWMDRIPGYREWVGERVFQNVKVHKFEVPNKDFEDSVGMSRNHINDDQYGVYVPLAKMLGAAWVKLTRKLVIEVFTGNTVTFTTKAMVADDHAYGDNTIDNKTASALDANTFDAAFIAAGAWKFSNNDYIAPIFSHLIVGPKLRSTAWNIVGNSKVASGNAMIDNIHYGRVKLQVWPELSGTYDDYWFLVDATQPIKPVSLQIREVPIPLMDTNPATLERTGQVDFMASGRAAAAPTFPHLVYGGIVA